LRADREPQLRTLLGEGVLDLVGLLLLAFPLGVLGRKLIAR
jgi:hypothetical protein